MTDKCILIICTLPVETFSRHMSYKIRNIIPIISVKKEMLPSSFVLDYIWILTNLVDRCLFVCFLKSINTFVNCELLLDALACPLQSQFSRPLCCFIWWRDYKNHKVLLPGDDKKGVKQTMRYNLWHFILELFFQPRPELKETVESRLWLWIMTSAAFRLIPRKPHVNDAAVTAGTG